MQLALGGWLGAYADQTANPQSWFDAIETTGRACGIT